MTSKEKLKKKVRERLCVPQKAIKGDENKNIEEMLGVFLVESNYIKGIEKREEDWGFVYYSVNRKIAISQKEMPHKKWEQCIFKMGVNRKTEENIFPSPGEETEKYRFLHEANHAYQDYLCSKESLKEPDLWYEKVVEGKINSPYARLFGFCFQKRVKGDISEGEKKKDEKGLSIWGNASNYDYERDDNIPNRISELAVRAQEDANELVTMFLWHPEYFSSYLDYLSLNPENCEVREKEVTKSDLEKIGLVYITKEETDFLRKTVKDYVKEMKKNISVNFKKI